tara:strand:+ start:2827 stop:3840 length:1014 start_codon:yes stop_codon:yes gene_type:complete
MEKTPHAATKPRSCVRWCVRVLAQMGARISKPKAPAAPALGSAAKAGSFDDVQKKFSSAMSAQPATPAAATEKKKKKRSWFGFRTKVKKDDTLARQRDSKASKAVRKVGECRVALDDSSTEASTVQTPSGWGGGAGVQQPKAPPSSSAPGQNGAGASSSTGPVRAPPPAVDAVDRAARVAKARTLAASISKIATGDDASAAASFSSSRSASGVDAVSLKERVATFREHEEKVRRAAAALLETKPKKAADKKRLKALALTVNGDEKIRQLASADCVSPRGEPGQGLDVAMARQLGCYASLCGGIVDTHGQSGRLGRAVAGHHGLHRLHLKARGCPVHA